MADAEANRNNEEVLRQREGADDAVEGEAGVEHFEIDEGTETAFGGGAHRLLRRIEQAADHLDRQEGQKTIDGAMHEGCGLFFSEERREHQDQRQHEGNLDALDRGRAGHELFKP